MITEEEIKALGFKYDGRTSFCLYGNAHEDDIYVMFDSFLVIKRTYYPGGDSRWFTAKQTDLTSYDIGYEICSIESLIHELERFEKDLAKDVKLVEKELMLTKRKHNKCLKLIKKIKNGITE